MVLVIDVSSCEFDAAKMDERKSFCGCDVDVMKLVMGLHLTKINKININGDEKGIMVVEFELLAVGCWLYVGWSGTVDLIMTLTLMMMMG